MKTITWYLNAKGVYLGEDNEIDIRVFNKHLEGLVGDVSKVVMMEIYEKLKKETSAANLDSVADSKATLVDKIAYLMRFYSGGEPA